MGDRKPKRYVVTMTDAPDLSAEDISKELTKKGFNCVEHLSMLNCLLGEFDGDAAELSVVPGVAAVEEEGTMSSQ